MGLGTMQKLKESWRAGFFVIGRHVSVFPVTACSSSEAAVDLGCSGLRVPHGFGLCPSLILVLLNKSLFKVFLCIYFPYSILHTCSWSYMLFPTPSHSHFSAISCPYRWQALGQNAGEREGLINLIQTIKNPKHICVGGSHRKFREKLMKN